ncbi:MAG: glycosyltransferase family 39 protein [Verrucomicrobiota bacterium]
MSAGTIRVIVLLLLILAVVTAVQIRLLNMPLERDEGEYAYTGQLMLQGIPPYQEAYNMKWPGTFAAYALIMALFGQTVGGIHAGLILVNLATAALVFLLARRMCRNAGGVVAAGTCALLSINPGTLGLFAHATHFVMLPALAGIVLLQNLDDDTSPSRIFSAGLLLGLAALMKQSGAAFGVFAAVWVVRHEIFRPDWCGRRLMLRLGWLVLGGILPLVLTCLALKALGVFDRFWLWTFHYARMYASMITFAQGLNTLHITSVAQFEAAPGLWSLAGLGLILLWGERSLARWRFFIISLLFFSLVAVCPGWYFRRHYFIQLLPVAGLLAAVAFYATSSFFVRRAFFSIPPAAIPSLIFAFAGVSVLIQGRDIYFRLAPAQVCRVIYGANPFPEAVEIGRYLASHCPPDARVAVIGSEPEIYFYSHRRSATGYIYTYPLMEPLPYALPMQQEMIREIEKADPEYVVFVNVKYSWIQRTNSNLLIFEWLQKYGAEHFQLAGLVEIYSDHSEYQWAIPTSGAIPRSKDWLSIFKNKKLPVRDKATADP